MKRIWIILMVLSTALALSVPAFAGKGGIPGPPSGDEPGENDFACAAAEGSWADVTWTGPNTFTTSIDSRQGICEDILWTTAGTWIVDLDVGSARDVQIALRDSFPGDWCWSEKTTESGPYEFLTPASGVHACAEFTKVAIGDDVRPEFAFTVFYTGGKKLKSPVVVTVTLP